MARKVVPEKVEEIKRRIISASIDLIINEGFLKFTLVKVAQKVGLTKAAIYWYFSSKEELLNELALRLRASFIDSLVQINMQPISAKQKIEAIILALEVEDIRRKCFLIIKIFLELYSQNNDIKRIIEDSYREYIKIVEEIFILAIQEGEIRTTINSLTLTKLFCATLDGCTVQDELLKDSHTNYKAVRDFYMFLFKT